MSGWRIRALSPMDADGRVVPDPQGSGTRDPRVVAWRLRWDSPDGRSRSATFTTTGYGTPAAARRAAQDLHDQLVTARSQDLPCDDRGRPRPAESITPASRPSQPTTAGPLAPSFRKVAVGFLHALDGEVSPKSVEYYATQVNFALEHMPHGGSAVPAGADRPITDITYDDLVELVKTRRKTAGTKYRRAVRYGAAPPKMCSVRTEKAFVGTLKRVFADAVARGSLAADANPALRLRTRQGKSRALPDVRAEATLSVDEAFSIANVMDNGFGALVLLRTATAIRTGEAAGMTVDDLDLDRRVLTVSRSLGEVRSRFNDGERRYTGALKQREVGERRVVPIPDHPGLLDALDAAVALAHERHERRLANLRRRITRWAREDNTRLRERAERELKWRTGQPPLLFTMPNGAPLSVTKFDRHHWKPALKQVFEPLDGGRPNPRWETRFYNLRHTAVTFWVAHAEVSEEVAAKWAGHSLQTQILHYRQAHGDVEASDRDRLDSAFRPRQAKDDRP